MEGAWIPEFPGGGEPPACIGLLHMKNNFYGVVNQILGFICYGRKNCPEQYTDEIHFPFGHHALFRVDRNSG